MEVLKKIVIKIGCKNYSQSYKLLQFFVHTKGSNNYYSIILIKWYKTIKKERTAIKFNCALIETLII
jgi:hypothetical protein